MPSSSRELSISTLNRLIRTLDFDEFFQLSAQEAAKLLDADGVAFIEYDDHDQLHYRFFYGLPTHYQSLLTDYKFPSDGGTAGQALQSGQPPEPIPGGQPVPLDPSLDPALGAGPPGFPPV